MQVLGKVVQLGYSKFLAINRLLSKYSHTAEPHCSAMEKYFWAFSLKISPFHCSSQFSSLAIMETPLCLLLNQLKHAETCEVEL